MSYSWRCPFCNHHATIGGENESKSSHAFDCKNKYGDQLLFTHVIVCPNESCREVTACTTWHDRKWKGQGWDTQSAKSKWTLIPQANVKVFPNYIPKAILEDYREACLIVDTSAKASATLSRRCLQGMIRDFWGISKNRLIDEIKAIEEKVDPDTWAAIDAVRSIGNIGAHMEKEINLIIDVDPDEAKLLIGLIETLLDEWYVNRFERAEKMRKIIGTSKIKAAQKNS